MSAQLWQYLILNWEVQGPDIIAPNGWENFKFVFSDPLGRIFAVENEGKLLFSIDGNRDGTATIPAPQIMSKPKGTGTVSWNVVSSYTNAGYRPLILTLKNELPEEDGDFITIYSDGKKTLLLRTTEMTQITDSALWVQTSASGPKASVIGPDLPDLYVNVVQASGGHHMPTYYVADLDPDTFDAGGYSEFLGRNAAQNRSQNRVWKWKEGMLNWENIVPSSPASSGPKEAKRFFVDPYRPDILYVLDTISKHIFRTENGGLTWMIDNSLEDALTEGGNFPFTFRDYNGSLQDLIGQDALLRDMIFDPDNPNLRFACGPAGVFRTLDGINWQILISTVATPMHPTSLTYDFVTNPDSKDLYVCSNNRGLVRLSSANSESLQLQAKGGSVKKL